MPVEDEVEGREGELGLKEGGEFGLDGAGPGADEDDEAVDNPGDAAARGSGVIARELFLLPDFFIRLRIDDKWIAVAGGSLHSLPGHELFPDTEERVSLIVVPEDADSGTLVNLKCLNRCIPKSDFLTRRCVRPGNG